MENHWRNKTATFVIHPDGYYAVLMSYTVLGERKTKYLRTKFKSVAKSRNTRFIAQYFWPFYNEYWVLALAEDYSYCVLGHPRCKFLSIMARKPYLTEEVKAELLQLCDQLGYPMDKLIDQRTTYVNPQHLASKAG